MIDSILNSIKTTLTSDNILSGLVSSGSLDIDIYDYELLKHIEDQVEDLGAKVEIKFGDIARESYDTYSPYNEYIINGRIDISENVNLNRALPVYRTGLQIASNCFARLQNCSLSGSNNIENLVKITPLSMKNNPNNLDPKKAEYINYTIDWTCKGFLGGEQ